MATATFSTITVGGIVSIEPQFKKSDMGRPYCVFSVAVNCFNNKKVTSNFYIVKIFAGNLYEQVVNLHLGKGSYVVINGSFELQYANGKIYPTIKPFNLIFVRDKRVVVGEGATDPLKPNISVYDGYSDLIEDGTQQVSSDNFDYSIFGNEENHG